MIDFNQIKFPKDQFDDDYDLDNPKSNMGSIITYKHHNGISEVTETGEACYEDRDYIILYRGFCKKNEIVNISNP